ncbi:hypothetical protein FRB99_002467 [Tulasnella sp. 403]|nr:hypothetical protein FRB99_002467 [Tulasnella sp. 403]
MGVLSFFQEVIANHIAGVPFRTEKDASFIAKLSAALKVDSRAFKMALYGFFISAPMGHYLNTAMLRIFAGRTSKKSKVARFCAQNFVVAPLQTFVFLISMAFIGGAKNRSEAMSKVHLGFGKMLGLTWVVQPAASWVAGRWVPIELWPPYYNLVYFTLGMYFKTQIKISQVRVMKTIKKEKAKAARRGSTSSSSSSSSSSSDSDKEKHD